MKNLIFLLIFGLMSVANAGVIHIHGPRIASAAGAPPALVQQKVNSGNPNAITGIFTVTLDAPVTPGNALIVGVIYPPVTDLNIVVAAFTTPSQDDTLAQVSGMPSGGTDIRADMWYKTNLTGGNSDDAIQVKIEGIGVLTGAITVVVEEWSGLSDTAPEDSDVSNDNNSTPTTASVTPTSADNVGFAIAGFTDATYSSGPTDGFTRQDQWDSSDPKLESATLIQTSATSKSTTWAIDIGGASEWVTAIAVFGAP